MVQLSHLKVDIGTVQLLGNMPIFKSSIQAATLKAYRQLTPNTSLDGRQELTGIYLCQPLNLERLLVFTVLSLSIYTPWVSLSYLVSYYFASQASISLIPSSAIVLMVRDMEIRRHGHTFLICQFRLLLPLNDLTWYEYGWNRIPRARATARASFSVSLIRKRPALP
jgi:hypothetical protein